MNAPAASPAAPADLWLAELTEAAGDIVTTLLGDCDGACLGTSAVLAYVLADHGVSTDAVRGTYRGQAHWWLETGTHRLDPTRRQFDERPAVSAVDHDEDLYLPASRSLARWTREQAVTEFARMFVMPLVGARQGRALLSELAALSSP